MKPDGPRPAGRRVRSFQRASAAESIEEEMHAASWVVSACSDLFTHARRLDASASCAGRTLMPIWHRRCHSRVVSRPRIRTPGIATLLLITAFGQLAIGARALTLPNRPVVPFLPHTARALNPVVLMRGFGSGSWVAFAAGRLLRVGRFAA